METLIKIVPYSKLNKIFEIINEALSEELETQIFVDEKLMRNILTHPENSTICLLENKPATLTYSTNQKIKTNNTLYAIKINDIWYALRDPETKDILMCASFIKNCPDYSQLVNFNSEKVHDYFQFTRHCKRVVFIIPSTKQNRP